MNNQLKMYGNYHGYYKRRNNVLDRIQDFDRDWFEGKICLDIGCNDGSLTSLIAEKFNPEVIIGMDLDKSLIESAEALIKRSKYKVRNESKQLIKPVIFKPRVLLLNLTGDDIPRKPLKDSDTIPDKKDTVDFDSKSPLYPYNIRFVQKDIMNFSEELDSSDHYHAILCLSVTKWIHLVHGDEGLLKFFKIMYSLTKNKGIVILEYQTWKSYLKRKRTSTTTEDNFNNITIKPTMFEDILTTTIGFKILKRMNYEDPNFLEASFHRPILILIRED